MNCVTSNYIDANILDDQIYPTEISSSNDVRCVSTIVILNMKTCKLLFTFAFVNLCQSLQFDNSLMDDQSRTLGLNSVFNITQYTGNNLLKLEIF